MKKLSMDNWNQPNDLAKALPEKALSNTNDILNQHLSDKIPSEVHELFESAKAIMVYGYFFYPLYKQGLDQLLRVGEAVLWHKLSSLGKIDPNNEYTFFPMIKLLKKDNIITDTSFHYCPIHFKTQSPVEHLTS